MVLWTRCLRVTRGMIIDYLKRIVVMSRKRIGTILLFLMRWTTRCCAISDLSLTASLNFVGSTILSVCLVVRWI